VRSEPTLHDIEREMRRTPQGSIQYDYVMFQNLGGTCTEFFELAERATIFGCKELANNPQLKQGLKEDQLTDNLVAQIKALGMRASHDTMNGGHCDIFIEADGGFQWIAEAKIWKGVDSISEGFLQLTSRYLVGQTGKDRGGVIIYCFDIASEAAISKWKLHLSTNHAPVRIDMPPTLDCCFRSISCCARTERDVHILHLAVPLKFEPIDKSGRTRAARR
jgi:hypothetical protein